MEPLQHLEEKQSKYERAQARQQERLQVQKQSGRKKLFKRTALWTGIAVLVAGSVYGLVLVASRTSVTNLSATELTVPLTPDDWKTGAPEAKVVLVEYSDFQCPACGAYYPLIERLIAEYGDRALFVYRHYPIRQLHKYAELAAMASEAAGRQNKFWEMHNLLFKNQQTWSQKSDAREEFEKYAAELELDLTRFKKDIEDQGLRDKVNTQYQSGNDSGVSGTPTFFLNNKRIQNPAGYDQFKAVIDAALAQNPS